MLKFDRRTESNLQKKDEDPSIRCLSLVQIKMEQQNKFDISKYFIYKYI